MRTNKATSPRKQNRQYQEEPSSPSSSPPSPSSASSYEDFTPITPSGVQPSFPSRVFTSSAKTIGGQVIYSVLIGLLAALGLAVRFLVNPKSFLTIKPRAHLEEKLHDPSLGEHLYLKVNNDTVIHAVSKGQPGAPLMVFVHGFPQFWYSWKSQMEVFSRQGYHCVAIDMRGYGDSDKPQGADNYSLLHLTADVEGVIKALGYQKAAAVVAHDWGAIVAYTFAARYPGSLEKLIILNGPHPVAFKKQIYVFPQIIKSCYVFFFQLPFLPELIFTHADLMILNTVFMGANLRQVVSKDDLELYKLALSKPGAITAAINYYRSLVQSSLRWIGKIQVPTLVIWGQNDLFLNQAINNELPSYIEKFTVKTIPNCSHWTCAERGEEVHSFITEFLH